MSEILASGRNRGGTVDVAQLSLVDLSAFGVRNHSAIGDAVTAAIAI